MMDTSGLTKTDKKIKPKKENNNKNIKTKKDLFKDPVENILFTAHEVCRRGLNNHRFFGSSGNNSQ